MSVGEEEISEVLKMRQRQTSVSYKIALAFTNDAPLAEPAKELIKGWIRSRQYQNLADCTGLLPPEYQEEGEAWLALRQIECFFKKNSDFVVEKNCRDAAETSFRRGETLCRIANKRLDWYYTKQDRLDSDLRLYLSRMEKSIEKLLGHFPRFLNEIPNLIRFTGGATEDRSRRRALPFLKISGRLRAPKTAEPLLTTLGKFYGFPQLQVRVCDENRVTLVPKSWKTHRTIGAEPTGSLPIQLAADAYIKQRLLRWGIDLSSQERNQMLAKQASLDNDLATVDLNMASDTLAFNTIAWMLPQSWFEFVNSIRVPRYKGVFGPGKYAKFSSMGNGCTFTLETLIFAAACKAVGSRKFSVYGDDIIIESDLYPKLMQVLSFLGFVINKEKSFTSGPYRESCGAHWYLGRNVTPFYLKATPKSRPGWNHLVNGLVRLGYPSSSLWALAKDILNQRKLPLVPFNDDTMSGVFVTPQTAYDLGLIKQRHSILWYRCYGSVSNVRHNYGRRSLFLWFLMGPSEDARSVTEVATGFRTYAFTQRRYVPPAVNTPLTLYAWSDEVEPSTRKRDWEVQNKDYPKHMRKGKKSLAPRKGR